MFNHDYQSARVAKVFRLISIGDRTVDSLLHADDDVVLDQHVLLQTFELLEDLEFTKNVVKNQKTESLNINLTTSKHIRSEMDQNVVKSLKV